MDTDNKTILDAIRKLEKSILEDGKVDIAETELLLNFARPLAATNSDMADPAFIKKHKIEVIMVAFNHIHSAPKLH